MKKIFLTIWFLFDFIAESAALIFFIITGFNLNMYALLMTIAILNVLFSVSSFVGAKYLSKRSPAHAVDLENVNIDNISKMLISVFLLFAVIYSSYVVFFCGVLLLAFVNHLVLKVFFRPGQKDSRLYAVKKAYLFVSAISVALLILRFNNSPAEYTDTLLIIISMLCLESFYKFIKKSFKVIKFDFNSSAKSSDLQVLEFIYYFCVDRRYLNVRPAKHVITEQYLEETGRNLKEIARQGQIWTEEQYEKAGTNVQGILKCPIDLGFPEAPVYVGNIACSCDFGALMEWRKTKNTYPATRQEYKLSDLKLGYSANALRDLFNKDQNLCLVGSKSFDNADAFIKAYSEEMKTLQDDFTNAVTAAVEESEELCKGFIYLYSKGL